MSIPKMRMPVISNHFEERLPMDAGRPTQHGRRIPEHVRIAHYSDGATVLDIDHGQVFRLNFVGSRILELLNFGLAGPEIVENLTSEFGIEQRRAEADLREFIETLENYHLLTSQNGNPPA